MLLKYECKLSEYYISGYAYENQETSSDSQYKTVFLS